MTTLSVIVPTHNESGNVAYFYERSQPVLDSLTGLSWKILFVNNGSTDDSLDKINSLRAKDPRVQVVSLSRNFGYHGALIAGLTIADSDLYAMIDADCEDPPELWTDFHQAIGSGAQLAYGIRSQRDEWKLITAFRGLFYHINNWIADSPTVLWMAEFSMITRAVRDAILTPTTTYPFLRAEMAYVGFTRAGVPYRRSKRHSGESHYRLFSMAKFAVAAFLSSSTLPLRLVLYLAILLAVGYPLAVFGLHLWLPQAVVLCILLLFYFVLFTVPMIALYLARTYKNGIGRPIFVVDPARTRLS